MSFSPLKAQCFYHKAWLMSSFSPLGRSGFMYVIIRSQTVVSEKKKRNYKKNQIFFIISKNVCKINGKYILKNLIFLFTDTTVCDLVIWYMELHLLSNTEVRIKMYKINSFQIVSRCRNKIK